MQFPLVSIIIPFKNTESFLHECLQSIINQTYIHWEIIAVNDHSTDQSLTIVESFKQQDSRIQVYNNNGTGIIEALRTAYSHSRGVLITRMDSDDIMSTHKIEVLATALLEKGKGNLAIGQVEYFSQQGISNGYERYEKWLNNLTKKGANYTEIYKECVIPSPCWMAYREDLDAAGSFTYNRYPEDYDLAFRFYEIGLKCIPCDKKIHLWRDYDTRTSRTSVHYAQNYFLEIKLHYFLSLEYNNEKKLILWGAGNKGKEVAKALIKMKLDFYWLCDNPKKIGKEIYGKQMLHYTQLEKLEATQTIVTVANHDAQIVIRSYLKTIEKMPMIDYFFFC